MKQVLLYSLILVATGCGVNAGDVPVDDEFVDSNMIQDGTVVEKVIDVDTPVTDSNITE